MKSRGIQFWILLIMSLVVSVLMLGEIYLSHSIIKAQHQVVDLRETASSDNYWKGGWQQLAMMVWRAGAKDPALYDLLKSEGIHVYQGPPPGAKPAAQTPPTTNAAPLAPAVPQVENAPAPPAP